MEVLAKSKQVRQRTRTDQHTKKNLDRRGDGRIAFLWAGDGPGPGALPNDPFILLLRGVYQPVVHAPNLGLSSVNLNDGTYSTTTIYPIFGVQGSTDQDRAIGNFYVQFQGDLCAYHLPGGAIAMRFLLAPAGAPPGFNGLVPFPDGMGGFYLEGTFELAILEATGIYQPFAVGHNHMVDRLHQLANGSFDEFCFCPVATSGYPVSSPPRIECPTLDVSVACVRSKTLPDAVAETDLRRRHSEAQKVREKMPISCPY
jgi:hypothetical protein